MWRIISIERGYAGEDLITLRSRSNFGALPEVADEKVPENARTELQNNLSKVVDTKFCGSAEALGDTCRATVTVVLSHWICSLGNAPDKIFHADVGDLLKEIEKRHPGEIELSAMKSAIRLLQRFHSRAKPNEQRRQN